jgi:hypothetical protein
MMRIIWFWSLAAAALAGCVGVDPRAGSTARVPVADVRREALPPPTASPPSGAAPLVTGSLPPAPGTPGTQPASAPAQAAAPQPFTPMTPQAIAGEWTIVEAGASRCRLTLAPARAGTPPPAEPSGCSAGEMTRVAAWQSRGQDVMLLDARGAPLILLRPTAADRFEGTGLSRERFAMTR